MSEWYKGNLACLTFKKGTEYQRATNLGKKILHGVGAVPKGTADFMKDENARKPKFKPEALPELKGREKVGRELELEQQLSKLDSKLQNSFKINYDKAFASLDGVLKDQKMVLNVDLKSTAPPIDPAAIDEKTKKTTDNLQALQSRFMARGPSNDPQREMAMTLKRLEDLQKQQIAVLQDRLETRQRADLNRLSGDNRNTLKVELIA